MIDSHTHLRDWYQWKKETIAHARNVAERAGLDAIFEQPNPDPPIVSRDIARLRLLKASESSSNVILGLILGLTSSPNQIREIVETHDEYFLQDDKKEGTVALKLFAGHSIGDLAVPNVSGQRVVYQTSVDCIKRPTLIIAHCEKELLMKPELWNPENPISHLYARPEIAETESIKDQIRLCRETGYAKKESLGRLHIAHVSTSESVDLVNQAQEYLNITCEVTPEHLLYDNTVMDKPKGIGFKMNPPLRTPRTRERLLQKFLEEKIDTLASDHAPHTYKDKFEKHMSGVHTLDNWPRYWDELVKMGASRELIKEMMHENVNEIFGTDIKTIEERGLRRNNFQVPDEHDEDFYAFNPTKYLPMER